MKLFKYVFLVILMWSSWALAEPQGTCWSPAVFTLKPNVTFSSGKAGTTAHFSYYDDNGGHYIDNATCVSTPNKMAIHYYKSSFSPNVSINGTEIYLNDYLEIKNLNITVWDAGTFPVPFSNVTGTNTSCKDNSSLCINAGNGSTYTTSLYRSMYTVSGDLVLRKDVLSGVVNVPNVPIALGYYSAYSNTFASQPTVTFSLGVAPVPVAVTCNINNGQQINVDFENIQSRDIGDSGITSSVRKDQQIEISCTSALNQDVEVSFTGTPASFSSDTLQTSSSDIGVQLIYNNVVVPPNGNFIIHINDGAATSLITFSIVKDPNVTSLKGGDFSASATLILSSV